MSDQAYDDADRDLNKVLMDWIERHPDTSFEERLHLLTLQVSLRTQLLVKHQGARKGRRKIRQ